MAYSLPGWRPFLPSLHPGVQAFVSVINQNPSSEKFRIGKILTNFHQRFHFNNSWISPIRTYSLQLVELRMYRIWLQDGCHMCLHHMDKEAGSRIFSLKWPWVMNKVMLKTNAQNWKARLSTIYFWVGEVTVDVLSIRNFSHSTGSCF